MLIKSHRRINLFRQKVNTSREQQKKSVLHGFVSLVPLSDTAGPDTWGFYISKCNWEIWSTMLTSGQVANFWRSEFPGFVREVGEFQLWNCHEIPWRLRSLDQPIDSLFKFMTNPGSGQKKSNSQQLALLQRDNSVSYGFQCIFPYWQYSKGPALFEIPMLFIGLVYCIWAPFGWYVW